MALDAWSSQFYGRETTSHCKLEKKKKYSRVQEEAYAIYNPTLVHNFISQRELIKSRMLNQPQVFNSKKWQRSAAKGEVRKWTYGIYEERAAQAYEWNSSEIVREAFPPL